MWDGTKEQRNQAETHTHKSIPILLNFQKKDSEFGSWGEHLWGWGRNREGRGQLLRVLGRTWHIGGGNNSKRKVWFYVTMGFQLQISINPVIS